MSGPFVKEAQPSAEAMGAPVTFSCKTCQRLFDAALRMDTRITANEACIAELTEEVERLKVELAESKRAHVIVMDLKELQFKAALDAAETVLTSRHRGGFRLEPNRTEALALIRAAKGGG